MISPLPIRKHSTVMAPTGTKRDCNTKDKIDQDLGCCEEQKNGIGNSVETSRHMKETIVEKLLTIGKTSLRNDSERPMVHCHLSTKAELLL